MGATRLDLKKHFCLYGCMRIASESQQNRPVFEADGDWRWKMGHLRQREAQTVVVEKRWGCPDGGQAWIDGQEGSSVCLVGLAGNHPLWATPLWPNAQFGPVLPTTGPLKCSTHAEEAELSYIRTMPCHTHLWWRAKNSGSSDGKFFCIHRIVRNSHQVITTYFCPWRTSLVGGSWSQESPVKIGSPSFLTIGKRASLRGAL